MGGIISDDGTVINPLELREQEVEYPIAAPTKFSETADFGALVGEGFYDEVENKIIVFAQNRFPDLPLEEALQRYSVTQEGDIVYLDDDKRWKREKGGGLAANALNIASAIPSEGGRLLLEGAAAQQGAAKGANLASKFATGARMGAAGEPIPNPYLKGAAMLAGGAAYAGGAGTVADLGIQGVGASGVLGVEEPVDLEVTKKNAAIAALGNIFGDIVTPALKWGFRNVWGTPRELDLDIESVLAMPETKHILDASDRTGIQLDPAEVTNLGQLAQIRRMLLNNPLTVNELQQQYGARNEQIYSQMAAELNKMGGQKSAEQLQMQGGKKFLEHYIDLKKKRSAEYRAMLDAAKEVPVSENQKKMVKKLAGEMFKDKNLASDQVGNYIQGLIDQIIKTTPDGQGRYVIGSDAVVGDFIGQLHNARKYYQGELDKIEAAGGGWERDYLIKARDGVDEILKKNRKFKAADKYWSSGELTKRINRIENEVLNIKGYSSSGNRIAERGDEVGDFIINKILNTRGGGVESVERIRGLYEEAGLGQYFDDLMVANLMYRYFGNPSKRLKSGNRNLGRLADALLGANETEMARIQAGLGKDKYRLLKDYVDIIRQIEKMPNLGSPTHANFQMEEFIGRFIPEGMPRDKFASKVAKVIEFWKWPDRVGAEADQNLYDAVMQGMADVWLRTDNIPYVAKEVAAIKSADTSAEVKQKMFMSMVGKLAARLVEEESAKEQKAAQYQAQKANQQTGYSQGGMGSL